LVEQNISPERHRILFGNHDNYDLHRHCVHALGNYGVYSIPDFPDIFFVRGAWSIDYKGRTQFPLYRGTRLVRQKDWWAEEELTQTELQHAIKAYAEKKPDIMISHEAPLSLVPSVTNPAVTHMFGYTQAVIKSRTNQALQAMLEVHVPKLWIFGHYHRAFDRELYPVGDQLMLEGTGSKTRFVCLNILRYLDFPKGYDAFPKHEEDV
jgi:hypothetical protein